MNLVESLHLTAPAYVAVVGGGGKTTTLFTLARQLDGFSWVTTSTHLGTDQLGYADRHIMIDSTDKFDLAALMAQKVTLITGPRTPDDRMKGPSEDVLDLLHQNALNQKVSLIIEADGARSHPVKAPAAHEPVIPAWAESVLYVVGCSGIGKPLNSEWVHRPEIFAQLAGQPMGEPVSLPGVVRMLLHPEGGFKNMPQGCHKAVLFNQFDLVQDPAGFMQQVRPLLTSYDQVLFASLQKTPQQILSIS